MIKVLLARIIYYLFYAFIFFIAIVLFIEIMNIDVLKSGFGQFLINIFSKVQF